MDVIVEEADKEYAEWEDFEDYVEDGGWDMSGSQDKKPIIEIGDLYLFAYHKKADKDTEIVCAKLSEVSESEKLVTFVDEDDKEYLNTLWRMRDKLSSLRTMSTRLPRCIWWNHLIQIKMNITD